MSLKCRKISFLLDRLNLEIVIRLFVKFIGKEDRGCVNCRQERYYHVEGRESGSWRRHCWNYYKDEQRRERQSRGNVGEVLGIASEIENKDIW